MRAVSFSDVFFPELLPPTCSSIVVLAPSKAFELTAELERLGDFLSDPHCQIITDFASVDGYGLDATNVEEKVRFLPEVPMPLKMDSSSSLRR